MAHLVVDFQSSLKPGKPDLDIGSAHARFMLAADRPVAVNISETSACQAQVSPEQPVFLSLSVCVEPEFRRQYGASKQTSVNGNHETSFPTVKKILLTYFEARNGLLSLGEHSTCFITQQVVADGDVQLRIDLELSNLGIQLARRDEVVCVQKLHVLASCQCNAGVARSGKPLINLPMDTDDARSQHFRAGQLVSDARIGAAVIHHQDFHRAG